MTDSSPAAPTPDDDGHGTPSKQHGDPLLAATQGRDEGSRQGLPAEREEPPASG